MMPPLSRDALSTSRSHSEKTSKCGTFEFHIILIDVSYNFERVDFRIFGEIRRNTGTQRCATVLFVPTKIAR